MADTISYSNSSKTSAEIQTKMVSLLDDVLKRDDPQEIVEWIRTYTNNGFEGSKTLAQKFDRAGYYDFDTLEEKDPKAFTSLVNNREGSRDDRARYIITLALEYTLSGVKDEDGYLNKWLKMYDNNARQEEKPIVFSIKTLEAANFFARVGNPDHDERDR